MGIKEEKKRFLTSLDDEAELLFAHIYDLSMQAEKYGGALYGDFISETNADILNNRKHLLPTEPVLFGGFVGAERKMVGFVPDYLEADFPISVLKITSRKNANLTHRDFLGSLMGLGIKREKCGDIILNENICCVFLQSDIARFVDSSLLRVGSEGVSTSIVDVGEVTLPERKFTKISGTVASLRLDSVLTLFIGTGRSHTTAYINNGRVFVNGIVSTKPDMHLTDGAIITVRGVGRAILEIGGTSRKDRTFITLNKYA